MNPLLPQNEKEFRASLARIRNMPEFGVVMAYLRQREDAHKSQLVSADIASFQLHQGRSREVSDIIDQLNKKE